MKTILIVDDEYDIVNVLETVLTSEGYAVRTAHNGEEALKRLSEKPFPDLIISDVMMPVMDGYALVRGIRARPEFRHLPVILSSAGNLCEINLQKGDYQKFLRKPFDLDEFISSVTEQISSAIV